MLERVAVGVLKDLGAIEVRRQLSGTQFGFDIWARVPNHQGEFEIWKIECKNLGKPLALDDVAPKLIWHSASATIDRFVLVSTSPPANDLIHFLESHPYSFPIELWTGDTLFRLVTASALALRALRLTENPGPLPTPGHVYLPRGPLLFDLIHTQNPPRQFAFYKPEGGALVKSFTSLEFKLDVLLGNRGRKDVIVRQLRCRTIARADLGRLRLLVQTKAKGLFEPEKLTYRPSTLASGETDVLGGKVVSLPGNTMTILRIELDEDTLPGAYELQFLVHATHPDGAQNVMSPIFLVLVPSGTEDTLNVLTFGRHYEDPVERILDLPQRQWKRLVDLDARDRWLWIGPLPDEVVGRAKAPKRWTIRAQDPPRGRRRIPSTARAIVTLPGRVGDRLYSIADAGSRALGTWEPLQWLPDQLRRRQHQRTRDSGP